MTETARILAAQGAPRAAAADPIGSLIRQAARGDVRAFTHLYDEVSPLVYGLARNIVRDPAIAEEITQTVMLTVWQQASRYDGTRGTGKTWIMTITHRRAVDRVRSEQALRGRDERYAREAHAQDFDTTAETVEARLEQQAVVDALAHLTELQREAIKMAYFGGHTYREVAQLLQAPVGTVKTRIRDGLVRLRDTLGAGEDAALLA